MTKQQTRKYNAKYRKSHRKEIAAYSKTWRKAHREEIVAYNKRYSATPEGIAAAYRYAQSIKKSIANRRYDQSNKGRATRKRYDQSTNGRQAHAKWNNSPRGRAIKAACAAQCRAILFGAPGQWTGTQWLALCNKFNNICLCCHKKKSLTPDHVIPFCKGGTNRLSNIQPLCQPCNFKKHDKTIDYRKVK